jgi:hypothetical protein
MATSTKKASRKIEPPDCYARAQLLAAEVELIRQEMGRPQDRRPAPVVKGAAPREVYFQALSLFRKADRLCYEITGDQLASIPHAPPIASIEPGDVLGVLDAAHREISETKARLGIHEDAKEPKRDASKTPSDVFAACLSVTRQLNLLLERPFAPGDVFQQVSLAVAYAGRLLAAFPNIDTTPDLPAFKRRQRPADCYDRIAGVVTNLQKVIARSGLNALQQAPERPGDVNEVVPGDVFDIASLALAEVAFLHAHQGDANPPYPFEANLPGRKLPSHVFQLAGVLESQVNALNKLVDKKPGWLSGRA